MNKKQPEIIFRKTQIDFSDHVYQLFIPPGLEDIRNLPVIVFLHALHERGEGGFVTESSMWGRVIKQYFSQVPAILLLPQCGRDRYWSDPVMDKMVIQALDETVREFFADPRRVYLIGVSLGGYGVWHFGFRHPGKFAALVPICGGSPLLSGDRFTPIAQEVDKTPVWVFHGTEDKVVPVSESRALVKALENRNGNVKYSEYPGVGHMVWVQALAEKQLMPWLLSL